MAGGMSTDVTTTKRSDCNTSCRLPVLNINTARSRDSTVKAYTLSGNCSDQISSHLQRFQCLSPEDLAVATMVRQKMFSLFSPTLFRALDVGEGIKMFLFPYYFLIALRLIIHYSKQNLSNVYN